MICETLLLGIPSRTLNLVVIVVQPSNVCASELCDFAGWPSNTTANVEDFVSVFDTDLRGEIVLMASNSLVERFTVGEATEVERLAPAVLVEICSEIVVTMNC